MFVTAPDAPVFKGTRLSYVMPLLPPTIMRDLELAKHCYKVFPMGPYYQGFPEGGSLTLYEEDSQRSHDEIAAGRRRTPMPIRSGTPGSAAWPTCSARCC